MIDHVGNLLSEIRWALGEFTPTEHNPICVCADDMECGACYLTDLLRRAAEVIEQRRCLDRWEQ